jgi:hypothetical protein
MYDTTVGYGRTNGDGGSSESQIADKTLRQRYIFCVFGILFVYISKLRRSEGCSVL